MAQSTFPIVPIELLKALEAKFKDTIPTATDLTLSDFNNLQGEQTVVRFLRFQYEKQNKNILEN